MLHLTIDPRETWRAAWRLARLAPLPGISPYEGMCGRMRGLVSVSGLPYVRVAQAHAALASRSCRDPLTVPHLPRAYSFLRRSRLEGDVGTVAGLHRSAFMARAA